jgi:hypothetical protein
MSNPATTTQIGSAGVAKSFNIPQFAVQWTGANGTTTHTLYIMTNADKKPGNSVTKSKDNAGETIVINRTDRTITLSFSAHAASDQSGTGTQAMALGVATDLPQQMDMISIGHLATEYEISSFTTATPIDPQIETDYAVCDSAEARFTPEKEVVVDITCTIYLTPAGTIKEFVAIS